MTTVEFRAHGKCRARAGPPPSPQIQLWESALLLTEQRHDVKEYFPHAHGIDRAAAKYYFTKK